MCVRPMNVKDNVVPCGKCFECRNADRNQWSIRVQHEIKDGLFITLTYSEEYNPLTLHKEHLIKYIKRIREQLRRDEQTNLKYFGTGEYGTKYGRPHYHIIINISDPDLVKAKWKYGIVHCGRITDSSIHYTTKYCTKNSGHKKDQKPKEFREFRIMSKGLGKSYLEKHGKHHEKNKLLYLVVNGKTYPLPRYYMNKLFGAIIKTETNKETGEITTHLIREPTDLSKEKLERQLKKLKKLAELYKNMLHKDIDDAMRAKYEKYENMYETLKFLKNGNI